MYDQRETKVKRYRVAPWSTGRDAGEPCGGLPTGVVATKNIDDIIAAKPDWVVYDHSPGPTGVAQTVELFEQLRGDACSQVDSVPIVLAHNIGGPTAVSGMTIPEGPGADGE